MKKTTKMSWEQLVSAVQAMKKRASASFSGTSGIEGERQRYPDWWRSKRKTRGRGDASLRSRSNRRKAAR